jgi:hypothetical protein
MQPTFFIWVNQAFLFGLPEPILSIRHLSRKNRATDACFNVEIVVIALQLFLLKLLLKKKNDTKKITFPGIFSAKIIFYIYNIRYLIILSKHISFNVVKINDQKFNDNNILHSDKYFHQIIKIKFT